MDARAFHSTQKRPFLSYPVNDHSSIDRANSYPASAVVGWSKGSLLLTPITSYMNTGVRASISKGFPEREIATTNEQSGSEQPGNQVVAVRFRDGERVFLKIATDGNHQRITRDAAAIRYAGTHCDVRVPQVLVADPTADPPYVATTLLHGTPVSAHWNLFETDEREAILRQVG